MANNPFQAEMDKYAISEKSDENWEEVHLDGRPLPVKGVVTYNNLATFQPKFTVGEPSKDSDNLFSVWIQNDWTGGGQIGDLNEQSDVQRFRHATTETRFPNMLTLPLETFSYTIDDAAAAYPLGDYRPDVTVLFWAAFGTKLRSWDPDTEAFIGGDDIAAIPVNKGVSYDGLLWIPQGDSGYDTWDGATVSHGADAAIKPVSFVEWDDKLLALSTTGQVSIWDGTSWDSPSNLLLKGDRTPRNLVLWWDQSGNPTVYVVTNRDVWAVDPLVPTLYRTGLHFPVHPDQGLGSVAWRDDAMYVSVGVGVHQLSRGNVVSAMGLDHNDGLPSEFRGAIVDLEGEYNGLLALVQGIGTTTVGDDATLGPTIEETQIYDDPFIVPVASTQARSTLQRWTGVGWHTVWESDGATGNPSRVMVSEAAGEYRLWWGYGTSMYTQPLRRTFYNPRDGMQLGIDVFKQTATLKTGRFDANMAVFQKSASHLEAHFDPLSAGTLDVSYQTDYSYPDWIHLGAMSGTGQHRLFFDPNGDGFPEGEVFHWIEFQYTLSNWEAHYTPVVMWVALKFIKIPILTRSWSFTVNLQFPDQWTGRGPREIADDLDALAANGRFITFKHRDKSYRVRVAQVNGSDGLGKDLRGVRTVNLVQLGVPTTGTGTEGQVHEANADDDTRVPENDL